MSKLDHDLLLDHGIDTKNERIWLRGSVDSHMYTKLVNGLAILNSGSTRKRRAPAVTVTLSTGGGHEDVAFALYDIIKSNSRPVRLVVCGPCHSAGTLLLAAADIREALPSSNFLYHFGSSAQTSVNEMKFNEQTHKYWVELIAERTNNPYSVIFEMHEHETYLNATQALEMGFIDRIVEAI